MLTLHLIALASISFMGLGDSVTLNLPDMPTEKADQVAENLLIGAFANHVAVSLNGPSYQLDLKALQKCDCFGVPHKSGDVALVLVFAKGTDHDAALDFANQLIAGKLHGLLQIGKLRAQAPVVPVVPVVPVDPVVPVVPVDPVVPVVPVVGLTNPPVDLPQQTPRPATSKTK